MNKRILSFVLVVILALSFTACSQPECEALGKFVCTSAQYNDMSVNSQTILESEVILELNENGKGYFSYGDDSGAVLWQLDGSKIRVTFKNKDCKGTYENDSISIDLLGSEVILNFEKLSEKEVSVDRSLSDSYYGWWKIGDAGDGWKDFSGAWLDCFAVIELDEQGRGELVLWDEDSSAANPIGRIYIDADEEQGFVVRKGAFMNCELDSSNWTFDKDSITFENMLIAELAYSDDRGIFNAVIYLRPWGQLWDDVQQEAPELMPYHYETWYLPLLEAGSSMPGEFEEIR